MNFPYFLIAGVERVIVIQASLIASSSQQSLRFSALNQDWRLLPAEIPRQSQMQFQALFCLQSQAFRAI